MSDIFQCGDAAALVEYLYDECAPATREAIAEHITRCASCAGEIDSLRKTRGALAAWTPPAAALGFQLTEAEALGLRVGGQAMVLRPKRWWSQPLPAWAQVAAAAAIFAAGLAIGAMRAATPAAPVVATAPGRAPAALTTNGAGAAPVITPVAERVSRDDLARLERQLRGEIAQLRTTTAPSARVDDGEVLRRVQALIDDSEARQRRDFVLNTARALENYDAYRRADLAQMQRAQGLTGAEVRQHREAIAQINNLLVNVSQVR